MLGSKEINRVIAHYHPYRQQAGGGGDTEAHGGGWDIHWGSGTHSHGDDSSALVIFLFMKHEL